MASLRTGPPATANSSTNHISLIGILTNHRVVLCHTHSLCQRSPLFPRHPLSPVADHRPCHPSSSLLPPPSSSACRLLPLPLCPSAPLPLCPSAPLPDLSFNCRQWQRLQLPSFHFSFYFGAISITSELGVHSFQATAIAIRPQRPIVTEHSIGTGVPGTIFRYTVRNYLNNLLSPCRPAIVTTSGYSAWLCSFPFFELGRRSCSLCIDLRKFPWLFLVPASFCSLLLVTACTSAFLH